MHFKYLGRLYLNDLFQIPKHLFIPTRFISSVTEKVLCAVAKRTIITYVLYEAANHSENVYCPDNFNDYRNITAFNIELHFTSMEKIVLVLKIGKGIIFYIQKPQIWRTYYQIRFMYRRAK